jgi:hypothetical protein
VNHADWSARKALNSSSGARSRVATIARHARPVPTIRGRGSVANGIPRARKRR